MSGIINPSFNVLTYNLHGHFHFPFSTSTSSSFFQKASSSAPLLNFGNLPLSTYRKSTKLNLSKMHKYLHITVSNLILEQMKIYFELIDISEYQSSAYLYLLLLLLTLTVSASMVDSIYCKSFFLTCN